EIPLLFHSALSVRSAVFIDEQHCSPTNEIDADDPISTHWVLFARSPVTGEEVPAATIRLVPAQEHNEHGVAEAAVAARDDVHIPDGGFPGRPDYVGSKVWDGKELYGKIGRLATVREFRGKGFGRVLVEEAVRWAEANPGKMIIGKEREWKGLICAHAQKDVLKWYNKLGFETDDGMGVWVEEGIEHMAVWRRVGEVSSVEIYLGSASRSH
ncbi:MAG: hypothetical protein Q9163_005327, partial [Psora crenata]